MHFHWQWIYRQKSEENQFFKHKHSVKKLDAKLIAKFYPYGHAECNQRQIKICKKYFLKDKSEITFIN